MALLLFVFSLFAFASASVASLLQRIEPQLMSTRVTRKQWKIAEAKPEGATVQYRTTITMTLEKVIKNNNMETKNKTKILNRPNNETKHETIGNNVGYDGEN